MNDDDDTERDRNIGNSQQMQHKSISSNDKSNQSNKRLKLDKNHVVSQQQSHEQERQARMARLRAQNDEEEERLARLDRHYMEQQDVLRLAKKAKEEILIVDAKELEGLDDDEQMQRLLGFTGFASTKGMEVSDNKTTAAKGAATKNKARKYRQYMNRKGGFNRPLDKMD